LVARTPIRAVAVAEIRLRRVSAFMFLR
jgi:hypothetical protein